MALEAVVREERQNIPPEIDGFFIGNGGLARCVNGDEEQAEDTDPKISHGILTGGRELVGFETAYHHNVGVVWRE